MGRTISFYRVTPDQLERALADGQRAGDLVRDMDVGEEPDGYLDKSWAGLQFLMDAANVGPDLRMDGDFIGDDGCLTGWSAETVAEVAGVLRAKPFDELARYFDPDRMVEAKIYPVRIWHREDARDYLRGCYERLVGFFEAAATSGSAAIMSFDF